MAPKTDKSCNWVKSHVSTLMLTELVGQGFLPAQETISWRAPDEESTPQPKQDEVVVFADHLHKGFRPPGSKFFRDVLNFFDLRPQDLGPNSITNLCQFQVFCEVYLQTEPTVLLFREFFYINHQTEFTDGPSIELGGVSIQRRRNTPFPEAKLASHPKGWNKTWFYCKNTASQNENPLPGYRLDRLNATIAFPGWPSAEERKQIAPIYPKIRALVANGLTGIDLTRCWISWRIQPLSHRGDLMCNYTGEPADVQRFSQVNLSASDINKATKRLLGEPQEKCNKTGLAPFCLINPVPSVSACTFLFCS